MAKLSPKVTLNKAEVPRFFYGTAWKEDHTPSLTFEALQAGFMAIDTANQRKHYYEEGVGLGLQKFLQLSQIRREDLFLQTKFTFARGQDHRLPYKKDDPFSQQVVESFLNSLEHLHTNYLDSYVLHGPYYNDGICEADLETWRAMEALHAEKRTRFLGVSNVQAQQLVLLLETAQVAPSFVQNRCFARMGWDKEVREICAAEGILYQGFSLLTANQAELMSDPVRQIARKHGKTIPQVIFRFCQQLGMICLTGTTDTLHMREDLEIYDFELTPAEVSQIEKISSR
jgi:diketogulonate reductase-like aldo/keto reductase